MKLYEAPLYQQGGGLFGDLFRRFIPIVSSKILPYVGRKLYESGKDVVRDIQSGETIGKALRRGAKRTLESGKQDLIRKLKGEGKKRRKKRDFFAKV